MCGISGIINKNGQRVLKNEIHNINNLISHRGPDDEGLYFNKNIAFGHRRLSILDLSKDGHQPMDYLDKYKITYNGEIYNYLEIKNELIEYGYKFKSKTDTEVILASFDKWGIDCVHKFNGMWAFAIYNQDNDTIFCSRDRFGIKPFYYTEIEGKFIFGSEIKQLLEFYDNGIVNKKILIDYLVIGYEEHTNETFFKNIYKLEQSHNLIYNLKNNTFKINRYYNINNKPLDLSEEESIDLYKERLNESIDLRLRSDVKVGTCLSGGLDSSSIAALASKKYYNKTKEKFVAIHAQSSEKKSDESSYAQKVSDHCNLDLNMIKPTKEDFINHIDEVIYTQEEPFGNPSIFMQYFVMKKAKNINCTVLLDGQGGDETLLGYERYYPAYLLSLSFTDMIRGFFMSSKNSKLSLKKLIGYFVYFTNSNIRIKRLKNKSNFIKREYLDIMSTHDIKSNSNNYLDIFKLQLNEIGSTQMPHLLRYEDKNSMRNSIETRLPLIDFKVLQTAISINNKFKIKNGWTKYILRKTINDILPSNITWRKNKLGFEAPSKTWLNGIDNIMKETISKSKIIKEITNDFDFNKLTDNQKWKLFNIAKWEDIYKVKN